MKTKIFLITVSFFIILANNTYARTNNLLSDDDIKSYQLALREAKNKNFEQAVNIAHDAKNNILIPYIKWLELLENKSDFNELSEFIYFNQLFPRLHQIRKNIETAISSDTSLEKIQKFFNDFPPLATEGKMIYAKLLQENNQIDEASDLIKEAWIDTNFNESLEKDFLDKFGTLLSQTDHKNKIDNLLWARQASKAKRWLYLLNKHNKLLAEARISLITNARNVDNAVQKVSSELIDNSGLVFDRAYWRRRKNLIDGAYEMHLHKSATIDNPEKWWSERNILIRNFMKDKNYEKAYLLASNHNLEKGESFALAEWLAGFISLTFLEKNEQALNHFKKLYNSVTSPVSLSRGAYWCGKASEKTKDIEEAKRWFKTASQYQTTFYGQIADTIINQSPQKTFNVNTNYNKKTEVSFQSHYVINIIKALSEVGEDYDANLFAIAFFNSLEQAEHIQTFLKVLHDYINRPDIAVAIGRRARYIKNIEIIDYSYPVFIYDFVDKDEEALILAIARQESNFNTNAKSHAGARGLMQIMPATAKRISKELKLPYNLSSLSADETYNIKLGNHYIKKQIASFDNNYILAIAAYNAGSSNVRRWLNEYGNPLKDEIDIITWLETIPFAETRNYVQRVLENYEVYRRILKKPVIISQNFTKIKAE